MTVDGNREIGVPQRVVEMASLNAQDAKHSKALVMARFVVARLLTSVVLFLTVTLFVFILFANLLGVIPGFESPTMFPSVPLGCAAATFLYYNAAGIRANGPGKYLAHFAGPVWWLAPIMLPIELVSHMARPLSLTIRLYANMFAGEQVTLAFLSLTYFVVPVVFMGLHLFVSLLQAYIFMLMTMIYVAGAVAHEH